MDLLILLRYNLTCNSYDSESSITFKFFFFFRLLNKTQDSFNILMLMTFFLDSTL